MRWKRRRPSRRSRSAAPPPVRRIALIETTNVQLPTGDRLQIPTGAETLRLRAPLILARNSTRDYREFADLVDTMHPHTAAVVLGDLDRYFHLFQPSAGTRPGSRWVATELVRRLADPQPGDAQPRVRRRTWTGRMSGTAASAVAVRCWRNEVTLTAENGASPVSAFDSGPADRPVEYWPDRPRSAPRWRPVTSRCGRRSSSRSRRDPFGRTARQVEEVLDKAPPQHHQRPVRGAGAQPPASGSR